VRICKVRRRDEGTDVLKGRLVWCETLYSRVTQEKKKVTVLCKGRGTGGIGEDGDLADRDVFNWEGERGGGTGVGRKRVGSGKKPTQ